MVVFSVADEATKLVLSDSEVQDVGIAQLDGGWLGGRGGVVGVVVFLGQAFNFFSFFGGGLR